jgi:hypothetical protein
MVRRVAGSLALLAFAVCLVASMNAGNSTATVLSNALAALGVTFVVGLAVGAMAQKMLDENVAAEAAKAAVADTAPADGAASKGKKEIPERIPEPKGR